MEGVHGLVFHFPAGIGAFDDVHHAGGVALVGVIVHREAVAEIVEGDLLRITQAEVDDFEVRAVRLEAEDRAAVTGVVLLPFLGGEIETTVADGAPDATVGADGEAVHVVAGERDAHAEAVFDDLASRLDAVLLGVLHHPELRDTGEVDRVVPGHDAGARAVEHVVEAAGEDLVRREGAVGLLPADMTDELGLRGHPFMGTLGFPLLVQGQTVGGGRRGEIVVIPIEVVTVVLDAEAEAVRLGDIHGTVVAEADGGGRGDAGGLAVGGYLESGARHERRAAFAGHADEAAIRLRLRSAALREGRLGVAGEDEMIRRDETPGADMGIDDPDDAGLALELGDVPDGLTEGQVVGTGGLAHDLAADDQLDGGLAGMIAAGDEEAEVGMRELHLRRGQRTGGGIAAQAGAHERVAAVVAELAVDAVDLAGDRRQAEAGAGRLPAVKTVAFEGFDDLGLGRKGRGAKAKGEQGEEGGLHREKRGTAQKRGCSLEVERPFQKLPFNRGPRA